MKISSSVCGRARRDARVRARTLLNEIISSGCRDQDENRQETIERPSQVRKRRRERDTSSPRGAQKARREARGKGGRPAGAGHMFAHTRGKKRASAGPVCASLDGGASRDRRCVSLSFSPSHSLPLYLSPPLFLLFSFSIRLVQINRANEWLGMGSVTRKRNIFSGPRASSLMCLGPEQEDAVLETIRPLSGSSFMTSDHSRYLRGPTNVSRTSSRSFMFDRG